MGDVKCGSLFIVPGLSIGWACKYINGSLDQGGETFDFQPIMGGGYMFYQFQTWLEAMCLQGKGITIIHVVPHGREINEGEKVLRELFKSTILSFCLSHNIVYIDDLCANSCGVWWGAQSAVRNVPNVSNVSNINVNVSNQSNLSDVKVAPAVNNDVKVAPPVNNDLWSTDLLKWMWNKVCRMFRNEDTSVGK